MLEGLIFTAIGIVVGWLITHVYSAKASKSMQAENERLAADLSRIGGELSQLEIIKRKLEGGAITHDEAAREIILALERGALKPSGLHPLSFRHCPECGGAVDEKLIWETPYGDGGEVSIKCKDCRWETTTGWGPHRTEA